MSHAITAVAQIHASGAIHTFAGPLPAIANPFDAIVPDFTVFGAKFDALWKKLFAGAWAIALILTAVRLLGSIVSMANHRGGNHPSQLAEARADVVKSSQAFGAVVGFTIILGIFFFLIS